MILLSKFFRNGNDKVSTEVLSLIVCYNINSEASFYALSVWETVYEITRPVNLRNETSVVCMDDAFELNVYVQRVRLIPVGFKTKLNTLFDIAAVRKRK